MAGPEAAGSAAAATLTHLDGRGAAHMVDVGAKAETSRGAIASAFVTLSPVALRAIEDSTLRKGDALAVARIAGIAAAKRAADLIPLCHPLRLTRVSVEVVPAPERGGVAIEARVEAFERTGVEMEALTAASVAALALYDMVKAVDRSAEIGQLRLVRKWGGRSGDYHAP